MWYNEQLKLGERGEANTVVAEVERSVYILQEHITDNPQFYCP